VGESAARGQFTNECVEPLATPRVEADRDACGGVVARERGPDAARRAGDEDGGRDRFFPGAGR
jgi:hypothetical protein